MQNGQPRTPLEEEGGSLDPQPWMGEHLEQAMQKDPNQCPQGTTKSSYSGDLQSSNKRGFLLVFGLGFGLGVISFFVCFLVFVLLFSTYCFMASQEINNSPS